MTGTPGFYHEFNGHMCTRSAEKRRAMQECVDDIVGRLSGEGIAYCLLRNRDRIPGGLLGWTDLDLMISESVSCEEVLALFSDMDPTLIFPVRRGFVVMFFPVKDLFLRLDVFYGDIEWRAAAYGRNREILAGRWEDDGIMVAAPVHQAFLAWFSRLLQHGDMPTRYSREVTDAAHANPVALRFLLTHTFGEGHANDLMRYALSGRPYLAETIVTQLRRQLWLAALRRRPATTLANYGRQLWNAMEHRIRPSGLSVAIVGPDTEANETLCRQLSSLPSRKVPYVIAEYMPRGTNRSLIRQWMAELIWTRQRLAHAKLVLRDYHPAVDVLESQPREKRSRLSLANLASKFAPSSDVVVVLDHAGAHAVPGMEINANPWSRRLPGAIIVDASQAPDEIVSEVLGIIKDVTTARTRNRYHPAGPSRTHPEPPPNRLHVMSRRYEYSIRRSDEFHAGDG